MAVRRRMPPELEKLKTAYEDRLRALRADLDKRDRELGILSDIAARIHDMDDTTAILEVALEQILTRMGLQAGWVFMGEQHEGKLHLAAHRGVSPTYLEEVRTEGLGECLCPEVFWSGHRMQVRNTTQCPRMPTIVDGLATPVAHACIPLLFEGETRGVLNIATRPGEEFSDPELRFLETVGWQICVAIERARHRRAERQYNLEARAMAAISKAVGGSLDVAAVLKAVGETAIEATGADRVHIFLGSDPANLKVAHLSGLPHPELKLGQSIDLVALGARLQRRALEERTILTVDDWARDERVNRELAERWGAASGIAAPLVARERVLGLLVLSRVTPHRWTEDQVDVAEALAAQAAMALENARLYQEARKAYEDLKEVGDRIIQSEKLAVVGAFASGLAHEVRNPLNSMALQLSILERRVERLGEDAGEGMRDVVAVIREEIRRLDSLVGDFLQFSRGTRIQLSPASLDALLDEVVRLLRPEARESNVTLRRKRDGDELPDLPLDAEKMKQVVINLVRNAIEAMPEGGVVTIESGLVDGRARLVVRDTGPGLPEGLDLFQLFVTTKPKGTGLGLSIAQQIVLGHGGEIAAESNPGQGAAFTVSIPLPPPEGATAERKRA